MGTRIARMQERMTRIKISTKSLNYGEHGERRGKVRSADCADSHR
jgi:hypothetical protein